MTWKFIGTRSEARCEAETSFSSVAFTVLLGAVWDPKFLEQKPWISGQIWLCSLKYVRSPLPALQPFHRGTRGACSSYKNNKRSKSPGWLRTEIQATSNMPYGQSSSVAFPALLKHTFWSETSWFLTADHFPQLLLSLPCWRGVLLGRWGPHGLWAHTGSSAVAVWPPLEIRTSPDTLPM